MNYLKIYERIISRGKDRIIEGYKERHHIIPRCMGGSNRSDNLVNLTPEEHYVCHQLLVKIYPDNHKLIYAATAMTMNNVFHKRSNKYYGWLKRKLSVVQSEARKGISLSIEHCNNISKSKKGKLLSIEHCNNISKGKKGKSPKPITEVTRQKLRNAKQNISEETRQKLRLAGQNKSTETRRKISVSNKGKKLSAEHIAKRQATRERNKGLRKY
jgi:hypothetical protein